MSETVPDPGTDANTTEGGSPSSIRPFSTDRSMKIRRTLVSALAIGGLLAVGFGGFAFLASLRSKPAIRQEQKRVYTVDLYQVSSEPLQEVLASFGTARSDHQVVIAAQVAGEIVAVHPQLRVGLRVPTQQSEASPVVLLEIDKQSFQQRVVQAERRLEEDAAELARHDQDVLNTKRLLQKAVQDQAEYRKEYERIRGLKAKGVATDSDVTKATLELRRYDEQVITLQNRRQLLPLDKQKLEKRRAVHESDLSLARLELSHATVKVPFGGVLGEVHVEQGQYVRPGEPLVRLVDDRVIEVPVSLTAGDYARVQQMLAGGAEPSVRLAREEVGPASWTGRVTRLAPEIDQRTRTGRAFVIVDNAKQTQPLVPGTFVHARIDGTTKDGLIAIPRDAIAHDKDNGTYVWVVTEETVEVESTDPGAKPTEARGIERRLLKPGQVRPMQTLALVSSDVLSEGEWIVLTNLDVLAEHSLVRVPPAEMIKTLTSELTSQEVTLLKRGDPEPPSGPPDETPRRRLN